MEHKDKQPAKKKSKQVAFIVRIAPELHEKLVAQSQADDRSLNQQLVHIIKKAVGQ